MVDNEAVVPYNVRSKHMVMPEQQPSLFPPASGNRGMDTLSRPEVARIISATENKYPYQQYLPEDVDAGLNLPTALAAMHAIDAKGQEQGWEYQDLLNVLPITRVALTTAGFVNAKEGLQALLTGATGELPDIMGKLLPPDAPKGVKGIAKTIIQVNTVDNMRIAAKLLIDEKKLESRLLKLTELQQDTLLDPRRTRALLRILNGEYSLDQPLLHTGLPADAQANLVAVSPFCLEDMKAITHLFDMIEWNRNSTIQIRAHRLWFDTELARLDAAGVNIKKFVSLGLTSVTKHTLETVLGGAGAIGAGLWIGGNEIWEQIKDGDAKVQEMRRDHEAARQARRTA